MAIFDETNPGRNEIVCIKSISENTCEPTIIELKKNKQIIRNFLLKSLPTKKRTGINESEAIWKREAISISSNADSFLFSQRLRESIINAIEKPCRIAMRSKSR
ncbi:hypothetical protein ABRQ03_16975 [Pectobacterium jejuense]